MKQNVILSILGRQSYLGQEPDQIELVTEGVLEDQGNAWILSYEESALTGMEGVTTTYLSHFIHDNLHMTFQEYVSSVRFERALKLLRDTSMCMTDVSVVSGFSDVKYLSRMLETYFGMSAQESCKQLRRETLVLQKSEQEQVQTFASDEQGRSWLEDFWKEYSTLRKEETYE